MGFTLISMVDFDAAAEVLSALGAARLTVLDALDSSSFLTGAAFTGRSFEADL